MLPSRGCCGRRRSRLRPGAAAASRAANKRRFFPRRWDEGCNPVEMMWERPGWAGVDARTGLNERCFCVGRYFNHGGLIPGGFFPIQTDPGRSEQGLRGNCKARGSILTVGLGVNGTTCGEQWIGDTAPTLTTSCAHLEPPHVQLNHTPASMGPGDAPGLLPEGPTIAQPRPDGDG